MILLFFSCTGYSPKPHGFYRIDIPEPIYRYVSIDKQPYTFNVSHLAVLESSPIGDSEKWINLTYKDLQAKIYCDYREINSQSLDIVNQECRDLLLRTVKNVEVITEKTYENPDIYVYGKLYLVDGETASPIQFVLTDSVKHFFRGALYYQCKMYPDSLKPVNQYLLNDIIELIQSFHWK